MEDAFQFRWGHVQRNLYRHIGQFKILLQLEQQLVVQLLLLDHFQQFQAIVEIGQHTLFTSKHPYWDLLLWELLTFCSQSQADLMDSSKVDLAFQPNTLLAFWVSA